jgi:small ligand-binding sensory domain FIST
MGTGRRFAAALSEHPVTAHAVGEVAGHLLEAVGEAPDLVTVFVTPPHAGALEDVAAAIESILRPGTMIGCAAVSVVGESREVEEEPAVVAWAGRVGAVTPVRLDDAATPLPPTAVAPRALLLVADPFSFDPEQFFAATDAAHPGLPEVGGMASAPRGPGGNRMVLNGQVFTDGAVGVLLGDGVAVASVVSQGCRPIGQPYVVTRSERNIVYELGGQSAYARLVEMANTSLDEQELALVNRGLHLGLVIDEHKATFERGDFLVRNVIGADAEHGAVGVNDIVDVGTTVQYHVRDAMTADEDLRALLDGRDAEAALVFTCNGRGVRFFRTRHHDARVVAESLDDPATAGFFAAGEFGPVGGRNFIHGFTASVVLFGHSPG